MKNVASQVILELVVALMGVILFFVGITRIWVWSNSKIVGRLPAYNNTRLAAGSSNPGFWGNSKNPGVYTPKQLTENWVFSGNASAGSPPIAHTPSASTNVPFASRCVTANCD